MGALDSILGGVGRMGAGVGRFGTDLFRATAPGQAMDRVKRNDLNEKLQLIREVAQTDRNAASRMARELVAGDPRFKDIAGIMEGQQVNPDVGKRTASKPPSESSLIAGANRWLGLAGNAEKLGLSSDQVGLFSQFGKDDLSKATAGRGYTEQGGKMMKTGSAMGKMGSEWLDDNRSSFATETEEKKPGPWARAMDWFGGIGGAAEKTPPKRADKSQVLAAMGGNMASLVGSGRDIGPPPEQAMAQSQALQDIATVENTPSAADAAMIQEQPMSLRKTASDINKVIPDKNLQAKISTQYGSDILEELAQVTDPRALQRVLAAIQKGATRAQVRGFFGK